MPDEYKALTVINLPFLDRGNDEGKFKAGKMIPHSAFEESAAKAEELIKHTDPDSAVTTADEMIADLIKWGSLSEDPDAELHPDHLPVDPNKMSLSRLVSHAQDIVAELEAMGAEVPAKLREFSEISDRQITAVDNAEGAENAGQ